MSDDDRKPGQEDDADEATQLRGKRKPADDDRTELRGGADAPDASPEADDEDETKLRSKPRAPQDVDDEEPTEFRGAPRDGSAEASDDEEDATELRGSEKDLSSTTVRPGSPVDQEDATELRGRSDDEATEINSRTQSMPTVGRTSLGPAADAPRLKKNADAAGDGESDATYLRGTPGATESDATRLRAGALPSDDDETVVGSDLDDDATVQALGIPPADEDATVQAAGGRAGMDDDDATVQAGRDDDPTVQGGSAGRAPPPPPRGPQSIGPGTVLKGRFTLEDKLGAGGMGGVFKAVDLVKKEARDRNPYVAVKVLNEAFAEHEDSFLALQRESSRSQRLTHPNIAAVYDFDRDGDTAYMIMELLEGSPLDSYLKKNKQGLDGEQARDIIRDISGALAYAHTQTPALVHSDFKPGNIFYTDDGAAKVFDFGIARAATETSDDIIKNEGMDVDALEVDSEDGTLFDAGKLGALTPAYAAIEMFEGRDPAPQDDVYALGIVAYQCITGKHPFNRQKAPVAAAQGMVPERPPGVTNREWKAIKRALEFKREDRTPDAQAFLDEFFYTGTKTLLAVAATAATMAIAVGALYFAGVIGPGDPEATPDPDWVVLESEISGPRRNALSNIELAQDDLETTGEPFETPDDFVEWEGQFTRDMEAWDALDSPMIVLSEGPFANRDAAVERANEIFIATGLSFAPRFFDEDEKEEIGANAPGGWRLRAGPFRRSAEDGAADPAAFEEFREALDATELAYGPPIRDDKLIAEAWNDALDLYMAEYQSRIDVVEAPRIEVFIRQETNKAARDYTAVAESDPPRISDDVPEALRVTRRRLESQETPYRWDYDADALDDVREAITYIEAAALYEEGDARGTSVLARADASFAADCKPRVGEDGVASDSGSCSRIADARDRAMELVRGLEQRRDEAVERAQRNQRLHEQYVNAKQARENRASEFRLVAQARVDGNVGAPIALDLTNAEHGLEDEEVTVVAGERRFETPGVLPTFTRRCDDPAALMPVAERVFDDVGRFEQHFALSQLARCLESRLQTLQEISDLSVEDALFRTRDFMLEFLPTVPRPTAEEIAGLEESLARELDKAERDEDVVKSLSDELEAARDLGPLIERMAPALAQLQRPDPCGNVGYVASGSACRDELVSETGKKVLGPPVVIVQGRGEAKALGRYAIGRYEVSVGEYNAFAVATGREELPGDPRMPATGVDVASARAYANWLSESFGREYRLPTIDEWQFAASAEGAPLDPNRNCYSNVRGVVRGESLVAVGQGAPNPWGLVNHIGNADELVFGGEEGKPLLVGGRHTDELARCDLTLIRENVALPDRSAGFRIVREIREQTGIVRGLASN